MKIVFRKPSVHWMLSHNVTKVFLIDFRLIIAAGAAFLEKFYGIAERSAYVLVHSGLI